MGPWVGAARAAVVAALIVGASGAAGCLNRPLEPVEPGTTSTIIERLTQSSVDKIDLLLAIDNSGSMADKQQILALAVPDLVEGLVNPRCIDPQGALAPVKPAKPTDDCPDGMERDFEPVLDIHIGIVSSSLGAHGAYSDKNGCEDKASQNDRGRLIARLAPTDDTFTADDYRDKGFLAWDPSQKIDGQADLPGPTDGEADIHADSDSDLNSTALVPVLRDMVEGVGQVGCGYEAQLESWYRFLVDPDPLESVTVPMDNDPSTLPPAEVQGTDTTLLAQRAEFLRPDSLLAIILLSDENDCSIRDGGYGYIAAKTDESFRMWRARSECAADPNDPCCASCNQEPPAGCPEDPTCADNGGKLEADQDSYNLRCFEQKRRFGIDFLQPTDRYVKGLTQRTVQDRAGELVPNPIFSDLDPGDDNAGIRDAGLVFLAGIVGVPWQDIARQNAAGQPDLLAGLDQEGNPAGGFKNADELRLKNGAFESTWDIILGDPAKDVPPADPHMIESIEPRSGVNPITGDPIAPPGSPNGTDPINGHEWDPTLNDDLQYACIFPLLPGTERDCVIEPGSCDCKKPAEDVANPLCEPPQPGDPPTLQVRAKAYPGRRQLEVIKGLGKQGIVGSVCPVQLDAARVDEADYGYRPAIGAIIDRLKTVLGGQCLPRTLTPGDEGRVSCLILEARNSQNACDCDLPGRQGVQEDHTRAKEAVLADPIAKPSGWDCVCEIVQVPNSHDAVPDAEERDACLNNLEEPVQTASGQEVNGWCYVDATTSPPLGNPTIVEKCAETEKRIIRFVGAGEALPGATLFITCSGE
jgi:hypothetical protein